MIDTFHLSNGDLNNQVFYTNGGGNSWQIWQKPSSTKMVSILVIGGGGGGGSGQSGTGSTTRRSGGGGGSSSVTIGMFSASQIPDTLYIQVGKRRPSSFLRPLLSRTVKLKRSKSIKSLIQTSMRRALWRRLRKIRYRCRCRSAGRQQ